MENIIYIWSGKNNTIISIQLSLQDQYNCSYGIRSYFKKISTFIPGGDWRTALWKNILQGQEKNFCDYDEANNRACIKLSEIDQDVFSLVDQKVIYPVNNSWGKQGWTYIEMNKVGEELFVDALTRAYGQVAVRKPGNIIQSAEDEL